jgi:hypothetical protein
MGEGAAERGEDFVGDEQGAMAACESGDAVQPASGLGDHAGGALDERFEDEGGVGPVLVGGAGEALLDLVDAFPTTLPVIAGIGAFGSGAVERAAIAIGGHDVVGTEEQTGVRAVKEVDVAEADGAEGVAVVGGVKREEAGFGVLAGAPRELIGEFQADLHGGGTIIGEEDLRKVWWQRAVGEVNEAGGELGGGWVG